MAGIKTFVVDDAEYGGINKMTEARKCKYCGDELPEHHIVGYDCDACLAILQLVILYPKKVRRILDLMGN